MIRLRDGFSAKLVAAFGLAAGCVAASLTACGPADESPGDAGSDEAQQQVVTATEPTDDGAPTVELVTDADYTGRIQKLFKDDNVKTVDLLQYHLYAKSTGNVGKLMVQIDSSRRGARGRSRSAPTRR